MADTDLPDMVPAQAPDGTEYKVPIDKIAHFKSLGWDVEDPHESLSQQLGAGAEGFAKGLIPGAPSLEAALLPNAGSIEEQKARAEANPITHGVGEFAGTGAQMAGVAALTEGAGAAPEAVNLASKGAKLAEALSPAAEAAKAVQLGGDAAEAASAAGGTEGAISAAADAAAQQAPKTAAEAAERASRATSLGYASQAAAGGVQGGSNYVNESELGDHDFNGEALAMNVGLGILFATAGEGAANVLGKTVVPKVLETASDAADALKAKLGNAAEKVAEKIYPEARGKFRPAMRAMVSGETEGITDAEKTSLAGGVNKLMESLGDVSEKHEAFFRPKEAAKNLQEVAAGPVRASLEQFKDQINEQMGEIQNKINSGVYHEVGEFKSIKSDLTHFEGALANPNATVPELHEAALTFKQALGNSGIHEEMNGRAPEALRAIADIKSNIWGPAKNLMRNESVWGAQGTANEELDTVTRRLINSQSQVAKDVGAYEKDLDTGKKTLYIKPSKVGMMFTGDPLANQEKIEHLGDLIDSAKAYIERVQTSAGTAGSVIPGGDDLSALLETLTAQREHAQATGAVTQLERAISRTTGRGPLEASLIPGLVAHAAGLGIPGVGLVAAAAGLAHNPVRAMQMFAKIAKASETARDVIGSGVRKIFATAPARAALTGEVSSAIRGRTIQSFAGAASGQDFQRQSKHITEMAQDQQRQMDSLSANTSRLSEVAPQTTLSTHGAAIRGIQVLFQALPKNPSPSLLQSENKDYSPPDSELVAWYDLHAGVLNPPRFVTQVADGTASPVTWAAIRQVYPSWAEELQQQTIDHLTNHPKLELDQAQKSAVSMIVGTPISPTVSPDQMAFQQGMYQNQAPPMAMPGGMPKQHRPSQHGMDKIDLGPRSALGPQSRKRG
jgi:hypothetical protein